MFNMISLTLLTIVSLAYSVNSFKSLFVRHSNIKQVNIRNHKIELSLSTSTYQNVAAPRQIDYNSNIRIYQCNQESEGKPILLFLPGLDGTGSYSLNNIKNLSTIYDVWRLDVSPSDRSSFFDLSNAVVEVVMKLNLQTVVLIGESLGGLLALHASLRLKNKVSQLVVVNPATSYDKTMWPLVGPLIANSGGLFPIVSVATLLATAVEPTQFRRIGQEIVDRITSVDTAITEISKLIENGQKITTLLPPETLIHRLINWLEIGTVAMKSKYNLISAPTLILIGKNDRLLPSLDEGRRLKRDMNTTTVELLEFEDSGHALLDGSFDLLEIISSSKIFDFNNSTIFDNVYPSVEDLSKVDKQFDVLKKLASPIFLSRDTRNYLKRGLGFVPLGQSGRPVVLVGNHQLLGGDMYFLVRQFLQEKHCLIRGLAHPIIFTENGRSQSTKDQESTQDVFTKFGAVPVSPTSYYELLKRNETILLFPGGAKEACHKKGEEYKLFWPEKVDFIRMATVFDAIVVPFAAIGVADSVNILLDRDELLELPYFGERLRKFQDDVPQVRAGEREQIIGPILSPKVPSRQYFIFQKPFDTRQLVGKNKSDFKEAYNLIKNEVELGIQTLFEFRKEDPYQDFFKRTLYERISEDQAPTASLSKRLW